MLQAGETNQINYKSNLNDIKKEKGNSKNKSNRQEKWWYILNIY